AELEEPPPPSRHTTFRSLRPTAGSLLSRLRLSVVLIINHGSLQSIDSTIQLGILLVVDKFLLVRAEESVAMPQEQCALLIRCQRRFNIRRYALLMNNLFAWGVIFRCGQPQR